MITKLHSIEPDRLGIEEGLGEHVNLPGRGKENTVMGELKLGDTKYRRIRWEGGRWPGGRE